MIDLENQRRRGRNSRKANQDKHTVSLEKWAERLEPSDKILILACGALAKEISALIRLNGWSHLKTRYLPAILHNTPEKITEQLRMNLQIAQTKFSKIFIGYADCGTGGEIDSMLDEFRVQRLPGVIVMNFILENKRLQKLWMKNLAVFFSPIFWWKLLKNWYGRA